ncbi:hypothetical protein METSCH_E04130 [Metschnikowia aff. pulcherrima]|uniref:Uncharacterized protein n=1 Tax=Metschnikowia aff. pulcherrima TaxID=2163413 RepID=A0A4P6XRH7_9ASCO|nr:hypothetical protein METSCH_E04130 [Metschnikowia aff. pulcherrima]
METFCLSRKLFLDMFRISRMRVFFFLSDLIPELILLYPNAMAVRFLQTIRNHSLNGKKVLSLEEFIFRRNVLSTYRSVMRMIYKHHERVGLAQFAREEFRMNSKETELTTRKYLLQTGISKINDMVSVFGINAKL